MTVSVPSITALKTVIVPAGRIRLVESEQAWFWFDPSSSAISDDFNVVTPNSGTGRWLKTRGQTDFGSGYVMEVISSSTTLTAQKRYHYVVNVNNGITTINLPANPSPGDPIKISSGSLNSANVTLVNRNGRPIRGNTTSAGLELFNNNSANQNSVVELTYFDNTQGWMYESFGNVRLQQTVTNSFTRVNNGDPGYFEFLGRNEGAASWVNPHSINGAVGPKIHSTLITGLAAVPTLTDRATSDIQISSGSHAAFGIILIVNRSRFSREFRLTELSIRNTNNVNWGTTAVRNFTLWGLRNADFDGMTAADLDVNSNTPVVRFFGLPNWVCIGRYVEDNSMDRSINSWGNYVPNIPVANDFFSAFMIRFTGLSAVGATAHYIGEVEFYGDARG